MTIVDPASPAVPGEDPVVPPVRAARRGPSRHRRPPRSWPELAAEVLGGWAATLRVALLAAVAFGGVGVVFFGASAGAGISGSVLAAAIVLACLRRREPPPPGSAEVTE
ncbi:hypothetical protein [Amycolatopsis magusensis]|uniref:hypothetical protein n=1 Tax=Amycolatopsis magusensis TaxID=882444 RepID=UPI003C2D0FA9